MKIKKDKLTFIGSMNYIVQIFREDENDVCGAIYQPRKDNVWRGDFDSNDYKQEVEETIERMKIAITQFEEFLEGKRDAVYFWELDNEPWQNKKKKDE